MIMAALERGSIAPSFQLPDLDGKSRSLAETRDGDLLLLAFYHSGCPTSHFAMPFIGAIARAIKSPRAKVWGISEDPEGESLAFARELGLEMPILSDAPPCAVSASYGLTNVPTLFLIDGGHRIIKNCVGFSKADFLEFAATLARKAGVMAPDIFDGRDDIPELRPG
jgi:peroxiredoxin